MGGLDISITGGAEFITLRYHEQDGNEAALTYFPLRTCYSDNEPVSLYGDKWHVFRCSECHNKINLCYNKKPNYCPNCGAKVVKK